MKQKKDAEWVGICLKVIMAVQIVFQLCTCYHLRVLSDCFLFWANSWRIDSTWEIKDCIGESVVSKPKVYSDWIHWIKWRFKYSLLNLTKPVRNKARKRCLGGYHSFLKHLPPRSLYQETCQKGIIFTDISETPAAENTICQVNEGSW